MGDDGLPVGAALRYLHAARRHADLARHRHRLDNVYLGRDYNGAIDDTLAAAGMRRSPDGRSRPRST